MGAGTSKQGLLLLAFLFLLFSCKPSQKTIQVDSSNLESQFSSIKAKNKINFEAGGESQKAVGNLRLQKDSLIWLSISNKIEAFRILVSPDSIQWVDRLGKTYYADKIDSAGRLFGASFDFSMIQTLLSGRFENAQRLVWKDIGTTYMAGEKRGRYSIEYQLDKETSWLKSISVQDLMSPNAYLVNYNGYVGKEGITWPEKISISGKRLNPAKQVVEFKVDLNFEKVESAEGESLSFPFKIPSKYERQ